MLLERHRLTLDRSTSLSCSWNDARQNLWTVVQAEPGQETQETFLSY